MGDERRPEPSEASEIVRRAAGLEFTESLDFEELKSLRSGSQHLKENFEEMVEVRMRPARISTIRGIRMGGYEAAALAYLIKA
jgi:hypothetical protein